MRRTSVLLAVAICGGIACESPTAIADKSVVERFALNETAARAFDDALRDVRLRVLPGLSGVDAENALAPSIDALASAIEARDEGALRAAMARTERAISQLGRDGDAEAIASDLDALRLILEHARPLADGSSSSALR